MNELSPNSFILGINLPLAALFLAFLGKKNIFRKKKINAQNERVEPQLVHFGH